MMTTPMSARSLANVNSLELIYSVYSADVAEKKQPEKQQQRLRSRFGVDRRGRWKRPVKLDCCW
eukprot:2904913-Amphidinium_carterae.1